MRSYWGWLVLLGSLLVGSHGWAEASSAVKETSVGHYPADYRECHGFPYHQLTGEISKAQTDPGKLRQALKRAGFRRVRNYSNLSSLPVADLMYADVVIIGEAHSGIASFYGKDRLPGTICHFRGWTVWGPGGKIVDRSDQTGAKRTQPLDHGIFVHTPSALGQLPAYRHKSVQLWRFKMVGLWKVTRSEMRMGNEALPGEPGARLQIIPEAFGQGRMQIQVQASEGWALGNCAIDLKKPDLAIGQTSEGTPTAITMTGADSLKFRFEVVESGMKVVFQGSARRIS